MLRLAFQSAGAGIVALVLSSAPVLAQSYESDQVVVKFTSSATVSCRDSSISLISGTVIDSIGPSSTYVVQLADTSVCASVALLTGRPCVEYAEPNYTEGGTLFQAPNDPLFYRQWHLSNTGGPYGATPGADIGALNGWAYLYSAPDVIVAIMDKGIAITRPDLADAIFTNTAEESGTVEQDLDGNTYAHDVHGWDFFNNDYTVEDDSPNNNPHGTSVASVFGATGNNELVLTGVTWASQILPVKILQGNAIVNSSTVAKAFYYAVDMGAKIINCSWRTVYSFAVHMAVTYAEDHDVLVIAGAGNDGTNNDVSSIFTYPASYPNDNVMAVASSDRTDSLNYQGGQSCYTASAYSNWGPTTVDIVAPGCDFCADYPDEPSCGHSGTSLAAPVVSGAAALLWQQNPTWTYSQVKDRLMLTVDTLSSAKNRILSQGRVDIGRALDNVKPSPISDLTVSGVGHYSQAISWTDAGDDTTYGRATRYHFKYQTGGAITNEAQFASAYPAPVYLGAPGPAGTFNCVVVSGLSPCTTYGWALKLEDPEFNISGLSNSASATTKCTTPPYALADCDELLMAAGGDGGEGEGAETLVQAADFETRASEVALNVVGAAAPIISMRDLMTTVGGRRTTSRSA